MANLGGGAEDHARFKQYEHRANSSLVLTTDSRPRDTHEPTGEPESLYGKIDPRSFGDRGKPTELEEKLKKFEEKKKKKKKDRDPSAALDPDNRPGDTKRWRLSSQEESVLSLTDEAVYQPRTKEPRTAYEALLAVIQQQFSGQPLDVVRGAADVVLSVLKNDKMKNPDKKHEIEKILNPIPNQLFDHLVATARLITDYHDPAAEATLPSANPNDRDFDDDIGVSGEFEEEEEEEGEESDYDEIAEDQEDDDNDGLDTNDSEAMQMGGVDDGEEMNANKGLDLNVQDIDAYWLQRKISQAYGVIDPQQSQDTAETVLKILAEGDGQDVENKLMMNLNYDKFNLIKLLLKNRLKIVWCTRLARAEDQEQQKKIEEEMAAEGSSLAGILEQLHATRASAKEHQKNLEKSIREEARRLKDDYSGGDGDRDRRVVDRDTDSGWLKGQQQLNNLESIALHFSDKKCELPPGSYRTTHKGYEEVHVPAVKPKPFEGEELIKISMMPDWAQPAFEGMTQLNRVQSKVYDTALFTPENILLYAPTGAGKSNVAMLAILHQIGLHHTNGVLDTSKFKIVYVAPMKALVAEVVGNLSNRLKSYNIVVKELSGDQSLTRQQIEETQIIVTTPEKWDIVNRKSGDRTYTQLVKLLIIDEIHLLHDNRGPALESIVARTVRQLETDKELIRLVGLSASLPNYEDVALFLRVNPSRGLFHFDNSYRPCPLAQQYIGITVKKPLQRFQLMNEICYEKVMTSAGKNQVLIFVHSRKETTKTARAIRDTALANDTLSRFLKEDSVSREILHSHTELIKSHDLKDLLPYGFAIHHAGMARMDRDLVEKFFAQGHVQVLVSTATLAWGVNLPAHTVIIKGTQIYNPEKGAWTEMSPLDVMQMLGRAGRPQYDSYGEGIILTGHSELQYYLSLMNQQLPIESQFISRLADQLNVEIVLGTVQNAREACTWIGYTYLYIQMLRNPTLCDLPADIKTLEERRADLVSPSTQYSNTGSEIAIDYTPEFTTYEIFNCRDSLIHWARETGKRIGLVIVIKTSDYGGSNGRKPRVTLGCERGGSYRYRKGIKGVPNEKPVKITGTKKCECPFTLKGNKLASNDDWMLVVVCGVHNHAAAEHLEGHSYAGRLSEKEASLLVDMSKTLVRPKDILSTLKHRDALNASTMKTIYNARHKQKIVERAGRSHMQMLLSKLYEHKYIEWHRSCDSTSTIRDLFWAHPVSVDLLRAFPCVLIMDCTYKTNRYHLPLLEIVGVTSTEVTFSVAFAYLESEKEDSYTWALERLRSVMDATTMPEVIVTDKELALMNAIERVFPKSKNLLCRWHISKNVLTYCKGFFETDDTWKMFLYSWNVLVLSSTEEQYNQKLNVLQSDFRLYPNAFEYVMSNWLSKYKERFVAAWTNTVMHFGNVTTNRAESAHAKLKRYITSSQERFENSWTKIHSLLELQHNDVKSSFEKSLTVVQHQFKSDDLRELRGFISISALTNVLNESKRANIVGVDASECGCVFRYTYGLPCAHEIAEYKKNSLPIPLSCVDPHWRKLDLVPTPRPQKLELVVLS